MYRDFFCIIAGNLGNMWIRFYIEKKGKQKETIIFFYIDNGKTQGNAFIENSEQSMDKKISQYAAGVKKSSVC